VVTIHHHRQKYKKVPYSGDGKQNTFKPTGPICPISNIRLGIKDTRAITFLVSGKEVVANYDAFVERCRKFGWDIPKMSLGSKLDVDIWLISVAKKFTAMPADKKAQKKLEQMRIFADTIGMKNFTSKLRRACR